VSVIRTSEKNRKNMLIFIIGILIVFIFGYIRFNKLKEKGSERDKELEDAYFGFVNRLAIHIGAGLSLKDAMKRSVQNERCIYLKDEINHMLNKISSGISDSTAYMEFGKAVGSQEYIRLMSLISQNLAYGNSNLIKMLDSETKTGLYIKREHIKKKGEEASEKLILPTSLLLILVIIIVIYPAFIEM
jgi:pilus assembly protein TadC